MRRLTLIAALLSGLATAHGAEPFSFVDGKVSFSPPPGFTRLSEEAAEKKYPRSPRAPDHVFANEKSTVTLQATWVPNANLTAAMLPEFKAEMEKVIAESPSMCWVARDYRTINGTKWMYFEVVLEGREVQSGRHSVTMMTFLDGGLVSFGYNSQIPDLATHQAALARSLNSVRVVGGLK